MAGQLEQARARLIHLTRLATWLTVARKMAHELKNSLTPIRLTTEEIASRRGAADAVFLEQASQIVADEVNTLERRVRAFSELASEPPVVPSEIDVNAMLEERVCLLKSAHPEVVYELRLAPERPKALSTITASQWSEVSRPSAARSNPGPRAPALQPPLNERRLDRTGRHDEHALPGKAGHGVGGHHYRCFIRLRQRERAGECRSAMSHALDVDFAAHGGNESERNRKAKAGAAEAAVGARVGLLEFLEHRGIRPGSRLKVMERNYDQTLTLTTGQGTVSLGPAASEKVWLTPASKSKH